MNVNIILVLRNNSLGANSKCRCITFGEALADGVHVGFAEDTTVSKLQLCNCYPLQIPRSCCRDRAYHTTVNIDKKVRRDTYTLIEEDTFHPSWILIRKATQKYKKPKERHADNDHDAPFLLGDFNCKV